MKISFSNIMHGMKFILKSISTQFKFVGYVRHCHTRHRKKPAHGSRYLKNPERAFEFNAWDDVQWDEEQESQARQKVSENSTIKFAVDDVRKFDDEASQFWNKFYDQHENKFFKDRHWLFTEFPELKCLGVRTQITVLEVGCGVGNTVFPLLQYTKDTNVYVYCCDFSSKAIDLVKENPEYDDNRCHAFVCDVTSERWDAPFGENSIDMVVLIFVLSAVRPEKMQHVVRQICRYLKPGGLVLFRDYGRYDMAQLRFKPGRCLGENFYVRGDGTQVYFFTEEEIRNLFVGAGLVEEEMHVDRRLQVNRGRMLKMYRVWMQVKFRKPPS